MYDWPDCPLMIHEGKLLESSSEGGRFRRRGPLPTAGDPLRGKGYFLAIAEKNALGQSEYKAQRHSGTHLLVESERPDASHHTSSTNPVDENFANRL